MLLLAASALSAASPEGLWKTIDETDNTARSYVKIWKHNGTLYGKVVKLLKAKPGKRCKDCPGIFKNKKILGMTIMWGLKKDGNVWSGGRIFSPRKNPITAAKSGWKEKTSSRSEGTPSSSIAPKPGTGSGDKKGLPRKSNLGTLSLYCVSLRDRNAPKLQ